MNRFKKEEARKRREARDGLSEFEIKKLARDEAIQREVNELARSIHIEQFPEEYDQMYDSIAEINDRKHGVNPMNAEYITKVAEKRIEQGVPPLSASGEPTSQDSWEIAYKKAESQLKGRNP